MLTSIRRNEVPTLAALFIAAPFGVADFGMSVFLTGWPFVHRNLLRNRRIPELGVALVTDFTGSLAVRTQSRLHGQIPPNRLLPDAAHFICSGDNSLPIPVSASAFGTPNWLLPSRPFMVAPQTSHYMEHMQWIPLSEKPCQLAIHPNSESRPMLRCSTGCLRGMFT